MKTSSSLNYLLLIALVTIITLIIYAAVQQTYRTNANDPQIQLAQDMAEKITQGKSVDNILKADTVDIEKSLAPFIALYDASGKPLNSTGSLNGKMPQPPAGIFEVAKKEGQHTITWQPQHGVRMALAVAFTNSTPVQFVVAGRSLKETEARVYALAKMLITGWLVCIALILSVAMLVHYKKINLT